MHRALLVAAAVAVCCQPSFAGYTISVQFAKPASTYNEFLHDRNACLGVASHRNWWTGSGAGGMGAGYATLGWATYNFSRFGKCMLARGYRLDPNGFHRVTFGHIADGNYRLLSM